MLVVAVLILSVVPLMEAYCITLSAPPGASLSYNGMTVTATCYSGYMIGPVTLTCVGDNWQPPSFGRCSETPVVGEPLPIGTGNLGQNNFPIGTGNLGQNNFPIGTGTGPNGFPIGTGGVVGQNSVPMINNNGPIGTGIGNNPFGPQPLYEGGFAAKKP